MEKSKIKNWEELVFEHRNKEYGAYVLRRNHPRYVTVAALLVISLFLTVMFGLNSLGNGKNQKYEFKKVNILNYKELLSPPPIERTPVPNKQVVAKQLEVEKYVAPVITQEEIKEPEETVIVEEVKETVTIAESFEDSDETESFEGVQTDAPAEPVFDIDPEYPGGGGAFMDWLERNLRYPAAAKRMGIEGKVIVEFIVDKNGKISDVSIYESLHRLCDREAIRLVKIMPVWMPGIKNGVKIRGKHTLEIPFVIKINP